MHDYEERIDTIEVMLGRMIIESDKAQRRQEKILTELVALISRNEKRAEENRKRAEEDRKQRVEEDRKRAEEHQQCAEEDRKRAEKYWQRVAEDHRRTREELKQMNKQWGELANKMGTLVEDIVAPNLPRIAKELFGGEIDDFMLRRTVRNKKDPSRSREFDVIVVCGQHVLLNETKCTVRIDYINGFIEVLAEFTDYFPEYADKHLVPIFASLNIPEDKVNYLSKHQIYALAMGDENMQILNQAAVQGEA